MTSPPGAARRRRSTAARLGWALALVGLAPLMGAVGVGYAAAWLPSESFWWAQLVAVGLPVATWALAAALVVPMLFGRWRWFSAQAVLIALVALRAAPEALAPTADAGPADLAVTTFNVPQSGPSREALGDSVVAFVERTRPDVLAMQDAWVYGPGATRVPGADVQIEAVVERLPYRTARPAVRGGTSVPVLLRQDAGIEVLAWNRVDLAEAENPSQATRAHLRWDGREFVLYNVHLRSFGAVKPWEDAAFDVRRPRSWLPYLRRYRSVYHLRGAEATRLAERIDAETLPVVVAGDFNSTADHHALRLLRGGRQDAFRAAGGLAWGRTYRADRPFVRIDFVLADTAFAVAQARTLPVEFSDHRPVVVHLRWRSGASPE